MPPSDDASFRGWRYEAFEERLALSAQPVADFWYDTAAESVVEPSSTVVQPLGSTEGHGYFTWVDQALQWVHQHRNDYEFPITTVNMSLGTEWNANTLPQWATLENDLKQLADDEIFISVAAGNSFQTYNAAGLSYPAV